MNIDNKVLEELKKLSNSQKAENRIALRAKTILLKIEGISLSKISSKLNISQSFIKKWWSRFKTDPNISSLQDSFRSGKPPKFMPETKAIVFMIACSLPHELKDVNSLENLLDAVENKDNQENKNNQEKTSLTDSDVIWTLDAIVQKFFEITGETISRSYVHELLNNADIRPHKTKIWLHSPDPLFKEKTKAICDLYLDENIEGSIFCIDEKTGMQATEKKHKITSAEQGKPVRIEFEYKRNGTQTLIAAFNIRTGEIFGLCQKTRTGADLLAFMEELATKVEGKITVIWDNLNIHHGKRWEIFNEKHGNRFNFMYTPIHASWLNQVEIWFGILHRKILRNGSFLSEEELRNKVLGFIGYWNNNKKVFKWKFNGIFN